MGQSSKGSTIISTYTGLAATAAIIPIPVADIVAISGVQIAMVGHLGNAYGKTISRHTAKGLLSVASAGIAGTALASTAKLIPGLGSFVGGAIQVGIAGTITYSLGLAMDYLLSHDKDLTRENLKQAIKNQDGDEIKKKKKEIEDKLKETKRVQKTVGFTADDEEFKKEVTFRFNLVGYESVYIRITDLEGRDLLRRKINVSHSRYTWRPEKLKKGEYPVYLEIDSLIPIGIAVKKV